MKKRRLFGVGAAALALAVGITSCQGLLYNNRPGQEIRFSASMQNGAMTRTAYSDEEFVVEGKKKERIDWENGDQVKIYLFLDNAPDYFFEPGENYEIFKKAVSDYSVAYDPETGKDAYKSRGTLRSDGTALRWVGIKDNVDVVDHWFYSVYPAKLYNENSVTPDQDNYSTATITFPDLSGQDGSMDYAYMAAGAGPYKTGEVLENQKNNAATVDLDYYPMVTTVYVTMINNTKADLDISAGYLKLSAGQGKGSLAGAYSIKATSPASPGPFGEEAYSLLESSISEGAASIALPKESQTTIPKSESVNIPFFLIPQEYDAKELSLTINGTTHPLRDADDAPLTLLPFHKYNVIVTINEDGKVEPPVINNALAQLIFALLNPSNGSDTSWPAHEEFWKEYFDCNSYSDFHNGFWQVLSKAISETKYDDMADKLKELFPGDKLTGLLDHLGKLETVKVDNSNLPKLNIPKPLPDTSPDTLSLSIFKNAKKIDFSLTESDMVLDVSGLNDLESIELLTTGECKEIELNVTDCPSFKKVTMNGDGPDKKILNLTGTPNFEEGDIKTGNGRSVEITLIDCSTEVENGGVITLSDATANVNVQRKPRKTGEEVNVNVDVVAGYYEYWPEYKYVEKHW